MIKINSRTLPIIQAETLDTIIHNLNFYSTWAITQRVLDYSYRDTYTKELGKIAYYFTRIEGEHEELNLCRLLIERACIGSLAGKQKEVSREIRSLGYYTKYAKRQNDFRKELWYCLTNLVINIVLGTTDTKNSYGRFFLLNLEKKQKTEEYLSNINNHKKIRQLNAELNIIFGLCKYVAILHKYNKKIEDVSFEGKMSGADVLAMNKTQHRYIWHIAPLCYLLKTTIYHTTHKQKPVSVIEGLSVDDYEIIG